MTYQVAMIGFDGWILVSDGLATVLGGPARPTPVRTSYETDKIRYQNRVASAPFGDDTAQIVRDRLLEELNPDPERISTGEFHRKMERFAEKVWQAEYDSQNDGRPELNKVRFGRERGIIFLSVEQQCCRSGNRKTVKCIDQRHPLYWWRSHESNISFERALLRENLFR